MLFSKFARHSSGTQHARAHFYAQCAIVGLFATGSACAYAKNSAPVISGTPPASTLATKLFSFQPRASDADGDKLRFAAWNVPAWTSFDMRTGRLYGTPPATAAGTSYKNIYIAVTDGKVWTVLPPFNLSVVGAISRTPVISGSPATTATVGQSYTFKPTATDPSGLKLTFNIQNKPQWAAFSSTTGALTGTPTQTGINSNIIISVTDGTAAAALSAFSIATSAPGTTGPGTPPPVGKNCGMLLGGAAVFCDTFDAPAGIGNRAGDLNGNSWGVSRALGDVNFGQGDYNSAPPTQLVTCNGTSTVRPPHDVIICNGQVREATNDNPSGVFDAGGVTALAMYPKQPFDFAGRTGTVTFDVSNDSHGNHAAWPEFWMSSLPVPVPYNHFNSWISLPQHGFGLRFAASVNAGQWGLCPNGNNLGYRRWTVDSAVVVRDYVYEDTDYQGVQYGTPSATPLKLNILDCVIAPPDGASGITNHVEVQVSQGQIDIYATDAGVAPSPATLRHIASIANANLSFTRGLIWLEDVHYNADKGAAPSQRQHTFVWDNVAFDGPFTYRDFSYDALDANEAGPAHNTLNLGKFAPANQTASWDVLNLPANPNPKAVRVLFNFSNEVNPVPTVINVVVNGHAHQTPWPYPDKQTNTWRTFAVTIPVTDLVAGTNVVEIGTDRPTVSSNINIVLVDVPGGVPVVPGNPTKYPGSP